MTSTLPLTVTEHFQRIPFDPGSTTRRVELHSGLSRHHPLLQGNLVERADAGRDVGLVMAHPASNFLSHFLLAPLAAAGLPVLAVNTRYAGNEAALIMENAAADLGAAVRWMRHELGFGTVVVLGFSGGGSLASFFQSQAEQPTVSSTPAGEPADLTGLERADALLLVGAHAGRARVLGNWIDPSVVEESDALTVDPRWDLYARGRTAPFDPGWVAAYREAQVRRTSRIDTWVHDQLDELALRALTDRAFVVHRTVADPRFLDLTLDPSDRAVGSMYGDPRRANDSAGGLARFTTLHSWLSTWSTAHTHADALTDLTRVHAPVLVLSLLGDQAAFASESRAMAAAAAGPCDLVELPQLDHHLVDQPGGAELVAEHIRGWLTTRGLAAPAGPKGRE